MRRNRVLKTDPDHFQNKSGATNAYGQTPFSSSVLGLASEDGRTMK